MEYVVDLQPSIEGASMDRTLVDAFDFYAEQLIPSAGNLRARAGSPDIRAAGEKLIALRDNLGLTNEKFRIHVCRHGEGINDCASAVEVY